MVEIEIKVYRENKVLKTNDVIKTVHTVLLDGEDPQEKAQSFLNKHYDWEIGLHYDSVKVTEVKQIKSENKMAKKKEVIEEAQVIEETVKEVSIQEVETADVEELNDTKFEAKLPAIPETFIVNGKEHSLAQVADIKKRADDLKKKATPESYEDKEIWESINELRLEAKDQRTKLEGQRKKLVKPIQDVLSTLKSKTDEIGNAAKEVEDDLQKLIDYRDNWEAEQERIRQAEIAKRTEKRKEQLREVGGKFDFENGVFSFEHDPATFINSDQLSEMTDEEFEEELFGLQASFKAEQDHIEEQKKQQQEVVAAANAVKEQLVGMREMILGSAGYESSPLGWSKAGFTITTEQIETLENTEFMTLAMNPPAEDEGIPVADTDVDLHPEAVEVPTEDIEMPPLDFDPLGDVISEKVEEHIIHQEKVGHVKRIEFVFTKEEPYLALMMGKSILYITHTEYEDAMLANVNAETEVLAKAVHGDLIISAIGKSKKK